MSDWGDILIGPSCGVAVTKPTQAVLGQEIVLEADVAQRFNAYAQAAWPREIGGLVRVVLDGDVWRAIDLKIFPHVSASRAYFELDGEAVAKFNMELVRSNRTAEIAEWRSLIHSHPNMAPFLSGTDRENVKRLAGPGIAFSLICSARNEAKNNYFACHYAQGGDFPFVTENIDISVEGGHENGTDMISKREYNQIASEVATYLDNEPPRSWFKRLLNLR
jgi:proteasome lid subunit RPN8/RPN11